MRRETAYKLAGRHHDRPLPGADIHKQREIRFSRCHLDSSRTRGRPFNC